MWLRTTEGWGLSVGSAVEPGNRPHSTPVQRRYRGLGPNPPLRVERSGGSPVAAAARPLPPALATAAYWLPPPPLADPRHPALSFRFR